MRSKRSIQLWLLATLFVASGVLHFLYPALYIRIVPAFLPAAPLLVLISGAAEVIGGIGLLFANTRRVAGVGLMILLVAVWPANVQMLLDARASDAAATSEALLWLRIPLQVFLIVWVWRATRTPAKVTGR